MIRRLTRASLMVLPLVACQCDEPDVVVSNGTVEGQACNPLTGQPEPGIQILATWDDPNVNETVSRTFDASDEGKFSFKIPEGTQTFTVHGPTWPDKDFTVDVVTNQVTAWKDPGCRELALPAGKGEILGQVCNRHTGSFVTGATVTVILSDGTELSAETDSDGNFVLSDVPAGIHVVYVRGTGFQKTYQIEVIAGEQVELEPQTRDCAPPDPDTTARIIGGICGPDPANPTGPGIPLAGVRVYVVQAEDGFYFEDETLDDGTFDIRGIPLTLNNGTVQVRAEQGNFSYTWNDVQLIAESDPAAPIDLTASVGCEQLVPDGGAKYLVVNGFYDKIQNVLERMAMQNVEIVEGNPIAGEHWATSVFGDYAHMAEYDIIFINCGVDQLDFQIDIDPVVKANLRQYVAEGGSLYVSDWAYDLVEKTWPEMVDFYGDDSMADDAEWGAQGTYVADVEEPGLEQYLGETTVTIDYQFRGSVLMREVASGVTTYLRTDMGYEVNGGVDTLEDMPITIGFTPGEVGLSGRVIFTSFHQETDGDEVEVLDGPEDAVLRYIVSQL